MLWYNAWKEEADGAASRNAPHPDIPSSNRAHCTGLRIAASDWQKMFQPGVIEAYVIDRVSQTF
jgi:hypothetical protein